jgi:hypothetical protein
MSAVNNVVQFQIPKKPRLREKELPPDQRKVSVVPLRALTDKELSDAAVRVLCILCSYTNRAGVTWVSQVRLAKDMGVTKQAISKQIVKLKARGYVEVVRKGFKAERTDTVRVIFDPTIDTETAVAVTSSIEDTRSPAMKEADMKREQEQIDREGLRRIQDMIKGVVKPVVPPPKTYQMPKGDTVTVAKMKAEIAAKKASKRGHIDNPKVDQQTVSIDNLVDNPGVDHNLTERTNRLFNKIIERELKVTLNNELTMKLIDSGITDNELCATCQTLLSKQQAEGLGVPEGEELLLALLTISADRL